MILLLWMMFFAHTNIYVQKERKMSIHGIHTLQKKEHNTTIFILIKLSLSLSLFLTSCIFSTPRKLNGIVRVSNNDPGGNNSLDNDTKS